MPPSEIPNVPRDASMAFVEGLVALTVSDANARAPDRYLPPALPRAHAQNFTY